MGSRTHRGSGFEMKLMQRPLCLGLLLGGIILHVLASGTPQCNEKSVQGKNTGGRDKPGPQGGVQTQNPAQTEDSDPLTDGFDRKPRSSDSDPLANGSNVGGSKADKDPTDGCARKPSRSSVLNANIHMIILSTLCSVTAFIVLR